MEGDAAEVVRWLPLGSTFFFYCPFGGERLELALDAVAELAPLRPTRVALVGMPVPARPWLIPEPSARSELCVCRADPRPR